MVPTHLRLLQRDGRGVEGGDVHRLREGDVQQARVHVQPEVVYERGQTVRYVPTRAPSSAVRDHGGARLCGRRRGLVLALGCCDRGRQGLHGLTMSVPRSRPGSNRRNVLSRDVASRWSSSIAK
jgi:hypothetical protein